MVSKGKLKMALVSERGTDFKKEHQKKMAKQARKVSNTKTPKMVDEWEDVGGEDSEGEDGDDVVASDEEDWNSGKEEALQLDLAGIDDSNSNSSSGGDDANSTQEDNEDENEEDKEDIPVSDLEDLDDEEKEDIIPHQRLTINNTAALTASLKRITLPLSKWTFSEHQSLTTSLPVSIADVSDDLSRELAFYAQSLSAVKEARGLLKAEGAPFSRPTDFFAEMVKADEHMAKIKANLIEQAAGKKAATEARKQRDLKKFGKQVQVAKLQERQKEKMQTLEKFKTLKRKRQGADAPMEANEADLFDVALQEESSKPESRRDRREKMGPGKRQKKDEKYGFGGKKRFSKSGDARSSGDLKGFSSNKMKGRSPSGAAKRPGKARRAGSRK